MRIFIFIVCTLSLNLANAGTKTAPKVCREIASGGFKIEFTSGDSVHVKCKSQEAVALLHASLKNKKAKALSYSNNSVDINIDIEPEDSFVTNRNLSVDKGSGCQFTIEL